MIRASAPVVAAVATRPGAAPPLPPLTPRAAAPPRPVPVAPAPAAPTDDLLPTTATPAPAPASATPRTATEDLLPVAPPQPAPQPTPRGTPKRRNSTPRLPEINRRLAALAAAAVIVIGGIWFVWSKTRDDVQSAARTPADALNDVQQTVNQGALNNAMAAANVLYLDAGSYAQVSPEALASVEPALRFVTGTQAPEPGEVSVHVVDAQSIVLATSQPDGTCQALTQSPAGTQQLTPPAPCAAASVPLGGGGVAVPGDVGADLGLPTPTP